MVIKAPKGWGKLNRDFNKWYRTAAKRPPGPEWRRQRNWLSKELVARKFTKEKQLLNMWTAFQILTDNCSAWKVQSKLLSLIVLCLDPDVGEDLADYVK